MLARHRVGVLGDTTTTINDGDNGFINREQNCKRKDNPAKPRSNQFQGKRMKLMTTSACKRCRHYHQEEYKNVTNICFNYDEKGQITQKCVNKRGENSG